MRSRLFSVSVLIALSSFSYGSDVLVSKEDDFVCENIQSANKLVESISEHNLSLIHI